MSINQRIASIENLIARDPGGRNIFGLVVADQLRLAAQSLRLARRVAIVSGFFVPEASAGETDGPPGAKVVGQALRSLGIEVDYITDRPNAPLFSALGLEPIVLPGEGDAPRTSGSTGWTSKPARQAGPTDCKAGPAGETGPRGVPDPVAGRTLTVGSRSARGRADILRYLDDARPTHLISIERVGRGADGGYRNMRGVDVTNVTAPLDELFLEGGHRGLTTIGIGDGGNEIGMGKVFAEALSAIDGGRNIASTVATDFCVVAGVSNWGAYGLAGALSVLEGRDLLPPAQQVAQDIERTVRDGGAVDGVTHRREPTVDGLSIPDSLRMLENIRRQIAPSPLERAQPLIVGILGYGETGRAAAALLARRGHRVRISDAKAVTLERGTVVDGVETGGHTIGFLEVCDLVVASPGVRSDAPVRDALHRRGIPVMSELEVAFQLHAPLGSRLGPGSHKLIAVTGTIGKRTTVELMQQIFETARRSLAIGGNRGRPLSELVCDSDSRKDGGPRGGGVQPEGAPDPIAVAVSSFQLETVVHFRPGIAVMLNIDEAHLDRHRTIAEYVRIKSRIFMNHRPSDALILNFDDPRLRPLARKHRGRTFFVSHSQEVDRGAWLIDGIAYLNVDGVTEEIGPAIPPPEPRALARADVPFPENLLSAIVAARLWGIEASPIANAVRRLCHAPSCGHEPARGLGSVARPPRGGGRCAGSGDGVDA